MRKPNTSADTIVRSNPQRFCGRVTFWFARLSVRFKLLHLVVCPHCKNDITVYPLYRKSRICYACGHHLPIPARERIERSVDPRPFRPFSAIIRADSSSSRQELQSRDCWHNPFNKPSTKLWRSA